MANIDFSDVTASAKANIYFDGKVLSHTLVPAVFPQETDALSYTRENHTPNQLD